MSKPDGGSIHAINLGFHGMCIDGEKCRVTDGLTIRDYFATHSMITAHARLSEWSNNDPSPVEVAEMAYAIADAMLAERSK